MNRRRFLLLVAGGAVLTAGAPAAADAALWARLRAGGLVVLVRHAATEPGVGDPPGFRLDDCTTQRNLSPAGRAQAQHLAAVFARERVPVARVLSSEWCRCRDTANLAFGAYEVWPALNNVFGRPQNASTQTVAILERAGAFAGSGNLVLVTHGSVIGPVAGVGAVQGELVLMRPAGTGRLELVGRLLPD